MITFAEYFLRSLNESKTQEEFQELVEGYRERLKALEEEGQDIHVSAPRYGHDYPCNFATIDVKASLAGKDEIEASNLANMFLAMALQVFGCPASSISLRKENGFADRGEFQLAHDTMLSYKTRLTAESSFVVSLKVSCVETGI